MRPADPVQGVPDNGRYAEGLERRGEAGTYTTLPTTLEEEALNGGWLPGARPTGPEPRQLFTMGMRGEPGWDNDPSPDTTNSYQSGTTHPNARTAGHD